MLFEQFNFKQWLAQCSAFIAIAAYDQPFGGRLFVDPQYRLLLESECAEWYGGEHQPRSGNQSQLGH
jgi:hypothetical protein